MHRSPAAPLSLALALLCACPPDAGTTESTGTSGSIDTTSDTSEGTLGGSSGADTTTDTTTTTGEPDTTSTTSGTTSTSSDTTSTSDDTTSTSDDTTSTSDDTSSTSSDTSSTSSDTSSTSSDTTSTSDDTSSTSGDTTSTSSTSGDTTGDSSTGDGTTSDTGEPECVQQFGFMDVEECYAPAVALLPVPGTSEILAGDFDGDGHADLVALGADGGIAVLLGDGSGALAAPVFTATDPPHDGAAGDLDGDGALDLVVSFAGATPRIDILLADGQGGFVVDTSFVTPPTVGTHLATGDFDGDGDLDAVAIHQGVGNTHPRRLTALTQEGGVWSQSEQPLTMFVADVTMDGWIPHLTAGVLDGAQLDLVVGTNRSVETLHRLRSDGLGGFTYEGKLHASLFTGVAPIAVVDVDDDGDADIVGALKPGTPGVKVVRNLGGGAWGDEVISSLTEDAKQQIEVGSLLHEPRPDLVYSAVDGRTLVRSILADGQIPSPGGFGFQLAFVRKFTLADLNEDGHSDFIFVTKAAPATLSVRLSE